MGEKKKPVWQKIQRMFLRETGWVRRGWVLGERRGEGGGGEGRCPSGPGRVKAGLQVCGALISPAVSHLWAWAAAACDPDQWTALRIMREGTPTGIMHSHNDHSIMQPLGQAVGRSVGRSVPARTPGSALLNFILFFLLPKAQMRKLTQASWCTLNFFICP